MLLSHAHCYMMVVPSHCCMRLPHLPIAEWWYPYSIAVWWHPMLHCFMMVPPTLSLHDIPALLLHGCTPLPIDFISFISYKHQPVYNMEITYCSIGQRYSNKVITEYKTFCRRFRLLHIALCLIREVDYYVVTILWCSVRIISKKKTSALKKFISLN